MIDIEIREASEGDWQTIATLLEENELSTGHFEDLKDNFILATYEGEIVGCVTHKIIENIEKDVFLIRLLAVTKKYRRKGIASELVKRKINDAMKNFTEVYARLWKNNLEAREFWNSLGFYTMNKEKTYDIFYRWCIDCRGDYNKMNPHCREHTTDGCPVLTYRKDI